MEIRSKLTSAWGGSRDERVSRRKGERGEDRIIGNHRAHPLGAIFRAMLLGVLECAWRVRAQVYNEAKRRNKEGGEREREGKKLSTTRVTRHNARQVPRRNFSWGWGSVAGVLLFFFFFFFFQRTFVG